MKRGRGSSQDTSVQRASGDLLWFVAFFFFFLFWFFFCFQKYELAEHQLTKMTQGIQKVKWL